MNLYNDLYLDDINSIANSDLLWHKLRNGSVLISGSTGLLGSFLIDVLMEKNLKGLNCRIYALGRSVQKAEIRFSRWINHANFTFCVCDVNKDIALENVSNIDYVLHFASNTHPMQYSTDPIGTIMTNIVGLRNMLEFAAKHQCRRFSFASSVEVYGENRGDVDLFDESYCGYINSNILRAGYPESKRCGEALCQAYRKQMGFDVVIPRFARSYGPTMSLDDSRAISQFLIKGMNRENIVLKSDGSQLFSYTYMADAVSGFLTALLSGKDGDAYNIADEESNISLKDLAKITADYAGSSVVYRAPDAVEKAGYSKATKSLMNGNKLKELGWKPLYSIKTGVPRTIDILRDVCKS